MRRAGLPHSEIPGSPAASASPGHFAAWPRPSSAADAKASTVRSSSRSRHRRPVAPVPAGPRHRRALDPVARRRLAARRPIARPGMRSAAAAGRLLLVVCLLAGHRRSVNPDSRVPSEMARQALSRSPAIRQPGGGAAGIRTPDLRRAKAALSQLSYGPGRQGRTLVGAPGLEPGTSALSGPRSNHLSYAPTPASLALDARPSCRARVVPR